MMNAEPSELERRYRRLLRAFPRGYRRHRGEEMLATLLDSAAPGQTRPTVTDTVDLLRAALRERSGLHAAPDLQSALRWVGPFCLAVTAGFTINTWAVNPASGTFAVVGVLWVVAVLAAIALPRLTAPAIAVAWAVTVGISVWAALPSTRPQPVFFRTDEVLMRRPEAYAFALELVCGFIALISSFIVAWRLSRLDRIGLGVAVAGAAAFSVLVGGVGHIDAEPLVLRDPVWLNPVRLVPFALLAAGLVAVVWRRSTMLLWSGLLLLVPYPTMVPESITFSSAYLLADPLRRFWTQGPWALVSGDAGFLSVGDWRTVGCTLLGAIAILTVFLADADRRVPRPRDGRSALAALSGVALGVLAGSCLYILADTGLPGAVLRGPTQVPDPLQRVASSGAEVTLTLAAALPLGFTVVAALAMPLLPRWLRPPVLLAVTVWLFTVPAYPTGNFDRPVNYGAGFTLFSHPVLTYAFRVNLILLVLVAVADLRVRGWTVLISTVATVVLGAWLSWLNEADIWAFSTADWQAGILYALSTVVLVLALWWAPVVIVTAERGWVSALFAFAAGLLWIAQQLQWIVLDHTELAISLGAVVLVVLAGRILFRRGRLRTSGTA
jgi:hypothetical protein